MADDAKLHQFIGQMLSDLGGAASVALVRIGDALGLYKALHKGGHTVLVQAGAGLGAGFSDAQYRDAGAHIVSVEQARMAVASGRLELPLL